MKKGMILLGCTLLAFGSRAQAVVPSAENQIKAAVLAAPADKRAGAAVYGYNNKQELTLLRKGTNELVCVADDPSQKGFSASCYHRDLDPFMARGRELKKQGQAYAARK